MKKNKMMRLASVLLVAVLMTTSVISGTFAKYTTADDADDTARVAKWGVTVTATGSLYGKKYAKATDNKITASTAEETVSVWGKQAANNKVVAPGTKSDEGFHFDINGNPEVDTLVTMSIEHENIFLAEGKYGVMIAVPDVSQDNFIANHYYTKNGNNYTLVETWPATEPATWYELHDAAEVSNAAGYWPVVYTMTGDTNFNTGSVDADSLKSIAYAIADRITAPAAPAPTPDPADISHFTYTNITQAVEQNENLATKLNLGNIGLAWEWEFDSANSNHGADTILGNLMADKIDSTSEVVKYVDATTYTSVLTEGEDYNLDTNFSINIKVEQVD
ncbi:MAG: hypothetical protein IJ499_01770 [Clostridia bacterium]|nr:hypothetical protein [Clostridia bacterium]